MSQDAGNYIVQGGSGKYPSINPGMYNVQIVDVLYKANVPSQYGPKNKYQFYLGILDQGEFRGRRVMYSTSTSFTGSWSGGKASNLFNLATAALKDNKLNPRSPFDVKSLLGKNIQVFVMQNDRGYADVKQIMPSNVTESLTSEEASKVKPNPTYTEKSVTDDSTTSQGIFSQDFDKDLDEE